MRVTSLHPTRKGIATLFLPVLLLCGVSAIYGKDFWESKDYKKWSDKDCRKMLENSPWAKKYEITNVDVNSADATTTDGGTPYIKYSIQIRSALPIRQAIVRQTQIANKYDDMSAEQREAFDKQTDSFLNADFSNMVVFSVTYETNHRNVDQTLARHWQTETIEMLHNSVYLSSSKSVRVQPAQYTAAGGAQRSFQFVFPRTEDGKELVGPDDKELILEFPYPAVGQFSAGNAYVEFKIDKMEVGGKLEY
jgi:hypothetical protein